MCAATAGVDFYWKRLLVEVKLKDHCIVSNGELMISRGLSVPLNDAPQSYRNAQSEAKREKTGVYSIFPRGGQHVLHETRGTPCPVSRGC